MTPAILEVHGVTKTYATFKSNLARFSTWFGLPTRPMHEFRAIENVRLVLHGGEALALIGPNGAGKSTLLKIIAGTVRPTAGHVSVRGRVSAMLELGLGFNHELTGRQNAYQVGGLMGLSANELDRLLPSIQQFAELDEFFDQPLRVYSSGMQARLAFSVATAVRPELLIVDEVLSVGDSYFQHKSFDRIRQFKKAGTAILFVSHSMGDVQALCDRVMMLENGKVLKEGPPDEVVDFYNAKIAERQATALTIDQRRQKNGWVLTRSGTFEATVKSLSLLDAETGEPVSVARVGQRLIVKLLVAIHQDIASLVLGYMIRERTGHTVWGTNTWHTKQSLQSLRKGEEITFLLPFTCSLGPGSYALTHALTVNEHHLGNYEWVDNHLVFDVVNVTRPYFIGSTYLDAEFCIMRS